MKNYRKIFEQYNQCSLLPGIDIHHIDGDHNNNEPTNLQAVTLEEHYAIHKKQQDFYAAYLIGKRMRIKPEDWARMAKENGKKSGIQNRDNGVGLTVWAKNNPEIARQILSENGKKGGDKAVKERLGFHSLSRSEKQNIASKGGKKSAELGFGFKAGHASAAGRKGGIKGGLYAKENKTGIFALTPEQIKAKAQKGALTKLIKNGKACAWPRKEHI